MESGPTTKQPLREQYSNRTAPRLPLGAGMKSDLLLDPAFMELATALQCTAKELGAQACFPATYCPGCGAPYSEAGHGSAAVLFHGRRRVVVAYCPACAFEIQSGNEALIEARTLLVLSVALLERLETLEETRAEA